MRSLKDIKRMHKKALVIIAHPDDETLFMGGLIAEIKRWRWTVLCVTDCDKRRNGRRRKELFRVCRIYNNNGSKVKPYTLAVVRQKGRFSKREIREKTRDFIDKLGPFEIVFTHNDNGEYGHKTHKLVHNVVKDLRLRNVYNFYTPGSDKAIFTPRRPKSHRYMQAVKLSLRSRRTKAKALNVYLRGSQKSNLSRIKKLISYALNTTSERCYTVN